ncbi:hypothetical protein ONE63_001552 [Megalurothrips usitatus]|uniref:Uncharacterized protein n=1 Tax=Megalurothrips usitatus TaxID=439358 RepID=A0AAV7XG64_9NEOP|nr:hypothetical protein ONE63_001552 [Megalurothrips usitatus]
MRGNCFRGTGGDLVDTEPTAASGGAGCGNGCFLACPIRRTWPTDQLRHNTAPGLPPRSSAMSSVIPALWTAGQLRRLEGLGAEMEC